MKSRSYEDRWRSLPTRGSVVSSTLQSEVTGHEPKFLGGSSWMDSEILWKLGTPSVAFGPIGTGAHASVEYVDIDSVITAAKILELSIKRFCGAA